MPCVCLQMREWTTKAKGRTILRNSSEQPKHHYDDTNVLFIWIALEFYFNVVYVVIFLFILWWWKQWSWLYLKRQWLKWTFNSKDVSNTIVCILFSISWMHWNNNNKMYLNSNMLSYILIEIIFDIVMITTIRAALHSNE